MCIEYVYIYITYIPNIELFYECQQKYGSVVFYDVI